MGGTQITCAVHLEAASSVFSGTVKQETRKAVWKCTGQGCGLSSQAPVYVVAEQGIVFKFLTQSLSPSLQTVKLGVCCRDGLEYQVTGQSLACLFMLRFLYIKAHSHGGNGYFCSHNLLTPKFPVNLTIFFFHEKRFSWK